MLWLSAWFMITHCLHRCHLACDTTTDACRGGWVFVFNELDGWWVMWVCVLDDDDDADDERNGVGRMMMID